MKRFRKFLNTEENGGLASVSYSVRLKKTGRYGKGSISSGFTIQDRENKATLEFYTQEGVRKGNQNIEDARFKIAVLKDAIEQFELDYEAALEERAEYYRKKRRKGGKKK